jgi:hypothetical protein
MEEMVFRLMTRVERATFGGWVAAQETYDRVREHLIAETSDGGRSMSLEDAIECVDDQLEGFVLFPDDDDA